ncbi:TetR/AcrR family transcriptional regulator [Amycolatopsis minnesotensis]|uniref:TetR family transcriptional regulator n=1 Tax=Amycolatopsis minnesotensis TaxID=337894 RepID=A0ABN2Q1C2_9PSEU
MNEQEGLRERKKRRTRETISEAAIALFLEKGFDQVPVAEVADRAEVSRRTLFTYFPKKEDLVVHRFADHETEAGRVVAARQDGVSPLRALREHFLDGLSRHDPITGLNDRPDILALYRMVGGTPALAARMQQYNVNATQALADALRDTAGSPALTAELAAPQIISVLWTLQSTNAALMRAGERADDRYPHAVEAAEHGFALLAGGLSAAGLGG